MNVVLPGDSITTRFATHSVATGGSADADALPTCTLVRNGVDTAESVTVTNVGTGDYQAAFTIPAGYSAGDEVVIWAQATVGGISGRHPIWHGQVETTRLSLIAVVSFPTGARNWPYVLTETGSGDPISDAQVDISTDIAGNNIIWRGRTNLAGEARDVNDNRPQLDPGTYYIWARKGAYAADTYPDTEVVS